MACLNKHSFAAPKFKVHRLDLEDGHCFVKELGAKDLLELRAVTGQADNLPFLHLLLCKTLVDDEGAPLFDSPDDVKENFNLPLTMLEKVVPQISALSGVTHEKN